MAISASRQLVEFLQDQAGSALRSAAHYDTDGYEFLYLRDDVADQYTKDELRVVFETLSNEHATATEQQQVLHLGQHCCSVQVYDEGIMLNFAQTDTVRTLITLDPEAGRNLMTFIKNCLDQLAYVSPYSTNPLE